MDRCPICQQPVSDVDRHCECGELLQPWRTIEYYGSTLRERGLTMAAGGDYFGACLSFFEAALSNPLDERSVADLARAVTHLGRHRDALQLVQSAGRRIPEETAESLIKAIQQDAAQLQAAREAQKKKLQEESAASEADVADAADDDDKETVETAIECEIESPSEPAAPPARPPRELLKLPPLARRQGWLSEWKRKKYSDALWETVVRLEASSNGDASLLEPLQSAVSDEAIAHYVSGLLHFLREEDGDARQEFLTCHRHGPPLLNAVAYGFYLHLEDRDGLTRLVTSAVQQLQQRDVEDLLAEMQRHLGNRLTESQCEGLTLATHLCRGTPPPPPPPPPAQPPEAATKVADAPATEASDVPKPDEPSPPATTTSQDTVDAPSTDDADTSSQEQSEEAPLTDAVVKTQGDSAGDGVDEDAPADTPDPIAPTKQT